MFSKSINMNYQKNYEKLVEKARNEKRQKNKGKYFESHHIKPTCLGGDGKTSEWRTHPNIVLLTPKEHFIAHKLLYFMYPNNKSIFHGYRMMAKMAAKTNDRIFNLSAREVEEIRLKFIESVSGNNAPSKRPEVAKKISESQKGKKVSLETKKRVTDGLKKYFKENPGVQKGRITSEDAKRKQSEAKKGKPGNPVSIDAMKRANLGVKRSQETKMKLSNAAKKRAPMSQETKIKISKSVSKIQKGRKLSEETKKKISQSLMGHKSFRTGPTSEETKQKISQSQKGKKLSNEHRLKLSLAAKKRVRVPMSEETKKKISYSRKKNK